MRALLRVSLALALLGCGKTAPEPPGERPELDLGDPEEGTPPDPEPEAEEEAAPDCEVSEPTTWFVEVAPRSSVGAARSEQRGVVALQSRDGVLRTRPLDDAGAPAGEESLHEVPGAVGLLSVELTGDGALVLSTGSCDEAAHCVLGQLLDETGAAEGTRVSAALPSALSTSRRGTVGDRVYLAWASEGGHRGLDYWTILGGSLGRARRSLGDEPAEAESPAEILGFTAAGDRWATIWRRGATEAQDSRVFLTTDEAHVAVEALHEALVIEAMELTGPEQLRLVAGYELQRPSLLELRSGEEEAVSVETIEAGSPVGEPFAEHVRVDLEVSDALFLVRRTAAGDRIGREVRVTEGRTGASTVVRAGQSAWQVFYVDRQRAELVSRDVECALNAP